MSIILQIHPENPQIRVLRQAVCIIERGGVIVYPTDSGYALACHLGDKHAVNRIRAIRKLEEKHHMTLVCRDLSELSQYAHVSNASFRLLKAFTPGAYTFILPASSEVPRRLQHPQRKTIGLRVPDHAIAQALLETIDQPLISTTLMLPDRDVPLIEPQAIQEVLGRQIDLIIDGGYCGLEPTTVVDLTGDSPNVLRVGKGDPAPFIERSRT